MTAAQLSDGGAAGGREVDGTHDWGLLTDDDAVDRQISCGSAD
jgi:hypothetical protein